MIISDGYRHISNKLTITSSIDKKSEGLEDFAISKGLWDGQGDFNFAKTFNQEDLSEQDESLFNKFSNNFKGTDMFNILRGSDSDISFSSDAIQHAMSSQVIKTLP